MVFYFLSFSITNEPMVFVFFLSNLIMTLYFYYGEMKMDSDFIYLFMRICCNM